MKGLDPSSLGLVRKAPSRPDGRFTPVAYDGSIVWALDPKYFNPDTVRDLQKPYRDKGLSLSNDCTIYVEDVEVKGFVTHSESTNVTKEFIPIYAGPNVITGESPYEYAKLLENLDDNYTIIGQTEALIDTLKENGIWNTIKDELVGWPPTVIENVLNILGINYGLAPWKLNYHPSMFKDGEVIKEQEIDLKSLPDIDLNSTGNITISGSDGASINYPLQTLLAAGNTKLRVTHVSDHLTGFWYILRFADREIQVKYDEELIQKAIVTDYVQHMLQNSTREIAIAISTLYNGIVNTIRSLDITTIVEEVTTPPPAEPGTGVGQNPDAGDGSGYDPNLNPGTGKGEGKIDIDWSQEGDYVFPIDPDIGVAPAGVYSRSNFNLGDNPVVGDDPIVDGGEGDYTPPPTSTTHYNESKKIDWLGGVDAVANTALDFGLRWASFDDMRRSSNNIGGTFMVDAVGQQVDMLITIDYPVNNKIKLGNGTTLDGGQFAANELHTFKVNSRFNGVNDLINHVKSQYPGELVRINGELVFDYGLYNEYFDNLVRKGALLR